MTNKQHTSRPHRADIDGLRAIAVLLVVMDHLQFRHFAGGYVGVDVFFLISGYLIGSSLISEFSNHSFSLMAFYERRVRRIFPALLAMLAMTSMLAYHYLMPGALESYAGSLLAALLSFSNFLFYQQAGYFTTPSAAKPLLHTWSLAVEEQFYVFFPLLLYVIFRWFSRWLRVILWSVAGITFAFSVWVVSLDSAAAFFWSPLRAWELIGGVLVSQHGFAALRRGWVREIAAAVGVVLILYPGMHYTAQTAFPGWTALFPCLGSALILAAGQVGTSGVGRILSTRPFTFIGLISYSLYLWHWPILVFQNNGLMLSIHPIWERQTKLLVLGVSLVVATLSWLLIERPFRSGPLKLRRRPLFLLNAQVAVVIACFAFGIMGAKGAPLRFSDEVLHVASFASYDVSIPWRVGTCFLMPTNSFGDFKTDTCLSSVPKHKEYLILGDSTAAQLYPGLVKTFPQIHFQQATSSACPPYADLSAVELQYRANCRAMLRYIHETYLPTRHIDGVILAAVWEESSLANLGQEIERFQQQGIPVILVGPVIEFDFPLPLLLSAEMQRHDSVGVRAENMTEHLIRRDEHVDAVMSEKARDEWHIRYISYFKDLCKQEADIGKTSWEANGCPLFTSTGEPLLFDNHHLTITGSLLFAGAMREQGQLP
jgi:peptidoglycan/LPS O-acetylase OafA/YrhL